MSLIKDAKKLADKELDKVSGGVTAAYFAAQDVIRGKYGVGEERRIALEAAGYNYYEVQRIVNGLMKGYDSVARDVINGKYGNDQARIRALTAAGYDPYLVQDIVNAMLL